MTKPDPHPFHPERLTELALEVIAGDRFPNLATNDGDQPRLRPVSPVKTDGFTVYVANLRSYNKTAEIAANPKVELCYLDDSHNQLRITGVAHVVATGNPRTSTPSSEAAARPEIRGACRCPSRRATPSSSRRPRPLDARGYPAPCGCTGEMVPSHRPRLEPCRERDRKQVLRREPRSLRALPSVPSPLGDTQSRSASQVSGAG